MYSQSATLDCVCDGGNQTLAGLITIDPAAENIYELFKQWTESAQEKPIVTGFQTQSIADIVEVATNDTLAGYYHDVLNSYNYLSSHPQTHTTHVRMEITSDWAEFAILTPNAYCEIDPNSERQAFVSRSKVGWNSGATGVVPNVIIE